MVRLYIRCVLVCSTLLAPTAVCACVAEKLRSENSDLKQQMSLKSAPTKGSSRDSSAKVKEMEALVARAAAENEKYLTELKQVTLPHLENDAVCCTCHAPVLFCTYVRTHFLYTYIYRGYTE